MRGQTSINQPHYPLRVAGGVLVLAFVVSGAASSQAAVRVQRSDLERFQGRAAQQVRRLRAAAADTLSPDVKSVTLSPGEFLEATARDSVSVDSSGPVAHVNLRYRYLGATKAGNLVTLSIAIEKSSAGLHFDPKRGLYEGVVSVGLDDSLRPEETVQLQTPIRMAVSAGVDTIDPHDLLLEHTNLPFERVRMVVTSPRDSVPLHVRPSFNREGQVVWLTVDRPQLVVVASPAEINGLGLETATITVGQSLSTGTWPIILSTDQGTLDSTKMLVSADRPAVVTLRSQGLGLATIRASHPQFREGQIQVRFVKPSGFLIAAGLGGLLGALVGVLTGKRARSGSKKVLGNSVAGLVTGLIVAVIYALGVNLTGVDIKVQFAEAATFAIAALAGAAGPEILTRRGKG